MTGSFFCFVMKTYLIYSKRSKEIEPKGTVVLFCLSHDLSFFSLAWRFFSFHLDGAIIRETGIFLTASRAVRLILLAQFYKG